MWITKHSFGLGVVALASFALAGCENNSTPGTSNGTPGSPPPIAHDADGHNDHEGRAHPSVGPHHGQLIALGKKEYLVELLHDDDTSTVTIYILDSAAKTEVPLAEDAVTLNLMIDGQPGQFKLTAKPGTNDSPGQASRFEIVDKSVLEALEGEEANGRLSVTINGKPYVGTIEHHDHDDHGHKH